MGLFEHSLGQFLHLAASLSPTLRRCTWVFVAFARCTCCPPLASSGRLGIYSAVKLFTCMLGPKAKAREQRLGSSGWDGDDEDGALRSGLH